MSRHCADIFGNGHCVVIEDENERRVGVSRIIHRLVHHAACERAVAEYGDYVVIVAVKVASAC